MATVGTRVRTAVEALNEISQRSKAGLSDRTRRLRGSLLFAVQGGLAASLAWLVAHNLFGHPHPYFAPIAAVIACRSASGCAGPLSCWSAWRWASCSAIC